MIIEGRSFTDLGKKGQGMLILLVFILSIALGLSVADKRIPKDDYLAVYDPGQKSPDLDKVVTGYYLIDGECVPLRVKMFYNFDDNLGKLEWWVQDYEGAQNNMGRPYRWTRMLLVPELLLWASIRNNRSVK